MDDTLTRLTEVLARYEDASEPYSEDDAGDTLRRLSRTFTDEGTRAPMEVQAEALAFTFMEDYRDDASGWGTYYGPVGAFQNGAGQWTHVPSIADVTPEVLDYWQKRVSEAKHPTLRARYADLVWDFARRVTGQGAHPDMARTVIDATLEIVKGQRFTRPLAAITKLQRALSLAISLNDATRVVAVRDAIIALEDEIGRDELLGLWGFAFESLVDNKRVPLPPELEGKIIADLEARLVRRARGTEGNGPSNPHGAERAATLLVSYYRRRNQSDDARRVLRLWGDAVVRASEVTAPLVATAWLERLFQVYQSEGMRAEAEKVAVRLHDAGQRSLAEMKPFSTKVEIPAEAVEQFLEAMTEGELEDVLNRIGVQFVPDKKELTAQVKEIAKTAVLTSMIRQVIVGREGQPLAQVGSVDDDLAGRVVQQAMMGMQFDIPMLRAVFERVQTTRGLSVAQLLTHVKQSPVFDSEKYPILEKGLDAYLRGDALTAAHLLIPQVEDGVRNIVKLSGGATFKPHRLGGVVLRPLDNLLGDERVKRALGDNVTSYFRVLFTDQRGWNLRNTVCHGAVPAAAFDLAVADRVLHALLVLALLRVEEPHSDGEGSSSGQP